MSVLEIHNRLRVPVFFFTLLLAFQMVTGFLLFHLHIGWSQESVLQFYKLLEGDQVPMSFTTFLETAVPHLVSMAMISFLVIHFLTFVAQVSFFWRWTVALSLAAFTLIDIFAGLVVIHVSPALWWFKILAFWGFQLSFLLGTVMMFSAFIPSAQDQLAN